MSNTRFDGLIKKWGNHTFSSGSYTWEDFNAFARSFKSSMKKLCDDMNLQLISFNKGHYYVSGFIMGPGPKYVYFSISDVRWNPEWTERWILIRTAQHAKDFTGGGNHMDYLDTLDQGIAELISR